jgi:hypothetical protein
MPIAWKGTLAQYVGRLHRLHPGKKEVRVFDYVDRAVSMLRRVFEKRLRGYRAIGYAESEVPEEFELLSEKWPADWEHDEETPKIGLGLRCAGLGSGSGSTRTAHRYLCLTTSRRSDFPLAMSTASLRSPPLAPEPEPEPEPDLERWTRGLPPLVSGANYAALGAVK